MHLLRQSHFLDEVLLTELEKIDGECSKYDIDFVKIEDNEEAADYGVEILPSLIYFENRIPSLFDEDLMDEEECSSISQLDIDIS